MPRGPKRRQARRGGGIKKVQRKAIVRLKIGSKAYFGRSSGQYGHAEMDALRKFIMAMEREGKNPAAEIMRLRTKTVSCPNQPVCNSCRIVLKALGFRTAGGTSFSREKSGGVSWGASMKVRQFLMGMGLGAKYQEAVQKGQK